MNEYTITCCSTCDLTRPRLRGLGVPYARYSYCLDGEDYPDDMYSTLSADAFFARLSGGAVPTTSQVTPGELEELFDGVLSEGRDLLHIEFSSGLSGGWQSALAARETMRKKYPGRKIYVVDSLAASSGYGLLVDRAASLKASGMGIDALYAWLEENKLRVRHWFCATSLSFLRRGGRVSGPAAAVGTVMGVCPVMDVSCEGRLEVRKRVVGKRRAIGELVERMAAEAEGGEDYRGKCFICHSARLPDAERLAEEAGRRFPRMEEPPTIFDIGTVIGSHTGPGVVALFFFGASRRGG